FLSREHAPAPPYPLSLHDALPISTRCFRLSRVTGQVRAVGKPGEVNRPEGVNLLQLVTATGDSEQSPVTTARLWVADGRAAGVRDRKSTRLNSSHRTISYAVFCLK